MVIGLSGVQSPEKLFFGLLSQLLKIAISLRWSHTHFISNSVCNHTSDKQKGTTAKRESDLLITSMITDRIGRHEVLLTNNQNCNKI